MMRTSAYIAALLTSVAAYAQGVAVLEVRGRAVEGKARYEGGGKVEFLDASIPAQVIHYAGGDEFLLPLSID